MLLKLLVFLTYQSYVMCKLDINRTFTILAVNLDNKCSGSCVTKCCPEGMVYAKVTDARGKSKSLCAIGEDGVFKSKQLLHDRTALKDYVYLPKTFNMLYGKPCKGMYVSNHPFYMQEVFVANINSHTDRSKDFAYRGRFVDRLHIETPPCLGKHVKTLVPAVTHRSLTVVTASQNSETQKYDNQSYQGLSCYPGTGLWRSDRQSLHMFSCIRKDWKPTPI